MNKVRVADTWKTISVPMARVSGNWRPCKQMWVKVGGTWKIVFDLTEPDPFDGTGALEQTPGNVPWEQLSGTWTKSSGVVSANDANNRVASIDAGTTDITINVDSNDANTAGEGIAFWIQDQLNWWGLKKFYNYFSFTTPSNQAYNHFCNVTVENQSLSSSTRISSEGWSSTVNYAYATSNNRPNYYYRRECSCTNGNVVQTQVLISYNCVPGCADTDFPVCSKTSCGFQFKYNCGPLGGCVNANCPSPTFNPYQLYSLYPCPGPTSCSTPASSIPAYIGATGGTYCYQYIQYTYFCSNQTCNSCTYSPSFTFSSTYFSAQTGNKNCTGPAGTTAVYTFSCTPQSIPLPPNTTFVYQTQLQLIRSQSGSVNVVNSQSYSNMGNVYASTSGNTITARAYSSTGQSGTLYGPWTYDAGSVPKGNKHGILISSVPYQQTYSISRFKADL